MGHAESSMANNQPSKTMLGGGVGAGFDGGSVDKAVIFLYEKYYLYISYGISLLL